MEVGTGFRRTAPSYFSMDWFHKGNTDWNIDRIFLVLIDDNFDTKIFILKMNSDVEKDRQDARGNTQIPKWIKSRHTQMNNLQNDSTLDGHLVVRENNTITTSNLRLLLSFIIRSNSFLPCLPILPLIP